MHSCRQVSLVERFVGRLSSIASSMRQGPPLNANGNCGVDIGALCLPGEAKRISALVEDARAHGAKVVSGGKQVRPAGGEEGQFFAPTLVQLARVPVGNEASMRLLQEEVLRPAHPLMTALIP